MSEMTKEKALEIVANIQGPDGLDALHQELQNLIAGKRQQIATIQGEVQGYAVVQRLLKSLKTRWGLCGETPQENEGSLPHADIAFKNEVDSRIKSKLCTFRKRLPNGTKEWCSGKLISVAQHANGYCKEHMLELGLSATGAVKNSACKPASGRKRGKKSN